MKGREISTYWGIALCRGGGCQGGNDGRTFCARIVIIIVILTFVKSAIQNGPMLKPFTTGVTGMGKAHLAICVGAIAAALAIANGVAMVTLAAKRVGPKIPKNARVSRSGLVTAIITSVWKHSYGLIPRS